MAMPGKLTLTLGIAAGAALFTTITEGCGLSNFGIVAAGVALKVFSGGRSMMDSVFVGKGISSGTV